LTWNVDPALPARILIDEAPGNSTSRSTEVSTSSVAVDLDVRVPSLYTLLSHARSRRPAVDAPEAL
jgi:hypothetical protein